MIKVSTFCSGIGSAEQAIKNLGLEHKVVLSAEIDKYARMSYLANHDTENMINDMTQCDYVGEQYYSDLNVSGLPCQSFSLAGLRLGENDSRGLLFYDFYRYVKNQQPKVFIIENVKGLISAEKGTIFQNWIELLGRSVNGHEKMFLHEDSLEYNLHYTVLNSKNFGVPQNRERVFIVGIRKDLPNDFRFPIGWKLDKRLRDVLETNVEEKYYLSEKIIKGFLNKPSAESYPFKPLDADFEISGCLTARYYKMAATDPYIKVKEATKKGYDIAEPGDSINMSNPNSTTRRGRVGKGIANTLDTSCNQAVVEPFCVAMRGRNPLNPSDRTTGVNLEQTLEVNSQGITNTITTVQKDNLIIEPLLIKFSRTENAKKQRKETGTNNFQDKQIEFVKLDISNTITTVQKDNLIVEPQLKQIAQIDGFESESTHTNSNTQRIRRLTPLECFRLQGYSDEFFYKCKEVNSDTQLYKQAGNTITVSVIQAIINNLKHILI